MDPAILIAALSASLEAVQTWFAFRDARRSSEALGSAYDRALRSPETRASAERIGFLIPEDLLDSLTRRVDKCFDLYRDVLDSEDEYLPQEIDEATEALRKCVCRELHRIQRVLGSIPDELGQWWDLYECEVRNLR